MNSFAKFGLGLVAGASLALTYRYYFTTPKIYVQDINKDDQTVKYKVGLFGKPQTVSAKELGLTGKQEKIRNGILKMHNGMMSSAEPTNGNAIKFETHSADDSDYMRFIIADFDRQYAYDNYNNTLTTPKKL